MDIAAMHNFNAELLGKSEAEFAIFRPWVTLSKPTGSQNERQSYAWIQHFHLYVAHFIRYYLGDVHFGGRRSGIIGPPRLLLPYKKSDTKFEGSDDNTRSDIGLVSCRVDADVTMVGGSARYNEVFAITEVKASSGPIRAARARNDSSDTASLDSDTEQAFKQLFLYTRQAYAKQPDRRFTWGTTICDSRVRACILTSGGALASHELDVTTAKGRSEYIQLLVNWSLCDWHQLGFDPSVRHCKTRNGKGYWEIDVPQAATGHASTSSAEPTYATQTYYAAKAYVAADHLFGRHTRCFLANPERPTAKQDPKEEILIKDSWSYLGRNQAQDHSGELGEIAFLTKIRSMVDAHPEFAGSVPRLENGGVVCLNANNCLKEDTMETVLGSLCHHLPKSSDKPDYDYTHVRLAMTPVGKRLREINSVAELIVVISDALQAHMAVLNHCQILHRDISENNILWWSDESEKVHGMLIDFDNAVDANAARKSDRPICTGTLPFMSVNNLREANVPRTAVDDMESVLYLLIWLGVWGVTTEHRNQTLGEHKRVNNWNIDLTMAIESKCYAMSSVGNLENLLEEFYKPPASGSGSTSQAEDYDEIIGDYETLKYIIKEVREAIFDNPNRTS
ncbi:hypothetical protein IWW36_002544 [Coemansia brasiliensis]|uniref:Fungal-type protein kinase domain-containing protein n=1 Tax=Coemansia brasiliensis TaxID=2650707 RepID=A0A9W8LZD1_9FUNG|nr:hypothetical protein IWW36_002544 [Coemansia brasiliensis]